MKKVVYIVGGIIIFITILATSACSNSVPYKVVSEEDISYINCKRVGIKIVVPDETDASSVEPVLEKIINENKSKWDDITVWAFKYSEEAQVGTIPYTMGMKEYSTCK
ncbi:hypothetical protein KKE14_03260 [Patescibacteria group bacterium]|nr:hypothetical protein [Patescibacteria group bacterium]